MAEDEENTMYLCTIVDFIALHTFPHVWSSFKTLGKGYSCSKALAPRVLKLDHKSCETGECVGFVEDETGGV